MAHHKQFSESHLSTEAAGLGNPSLGDHVTELFPIWRVENIKHSNNYTEEAI